MEILKNPYHKWTKNTKLKWKSLENFLIEQGNNFTVTQIENDTTLWSHDGQCALKEYIAKRKKEELIFLWKSNET